MWSRYGAHGFKVEKTQLLKTMTLDRLACLGTRKTLIPGEFLKIDCQGMEYEILRGARRMLQEQCVAAYIELEFFSFYKRQRLFSDVDAYMRAKGFQLYGLFPHYISNKIIDRLKYDYQERIAWTDALYFKDPLASDKHAEKLSKRNIDALLLATILTRFYDFSLELADRYYKGKLEHGRIVKLILSLAAADKRSFERDARILAARIGKEPGKSFLLARKFIDSHKTNSDLDFIKMG